MNHLQIPPIIPDHELFRCIGHGSYGTVWLAKNTMGTYRAVKIVYRSSFENERPYERELSGIRKFEPISRSHNGFIDILQVGINETLGYFYYVMELGDDEIIRPEIDPVTYSPKTLAQRLHKRQKIGVEDCLNLGLDLSQALSELHKHGLVHRDIKPANIIFVHGIPKLADIGLVTDLNDTRSHVGTDGFIPPEGSGTPQADIYGLGKVLYEAVTGKDRNDFPELPTLLESFPDRNPFLELNEVILRACHNNVDKRYLSAKQLHGDLLVVMNGKSVKRLRLLENRLVRVKRIGIAGLLAVLAATGISYLVIHEQQKTIEIIQQKIGGEIAKGNQAMESGDWLGSLPYFVDALHLDKDKSRETTHRLRIGSILEQCPKLTQMWFSTNQIDDVMFNPSGDQLLIAEKYGSIKICDLKTGHLSLAPFGAGKGLRSAAFSHDGKMVAAANEDGKVCLWTLQPFKKLETFLHDQIVFSVRFSPDDRQIITASGDGVARVWNLQAREVTLELTDPKPIFFANFSPDGKRIVTCADGNARVWDAASRTAIGPVLHHDSWVTCASFSPDGQRLATACLDHKGRVWDLAHENQRIMPDLNHVDGVKCVEFSPDGRLLLTAGLDGVAHFWRSDNLQPVSGNPILKQSERIINACFDGEGRRVAIAGSAGTVRIWDFAGSVGNSTTTSAIPSPDGGKMLSLTNNRAIIRDVISSETFTINPAKAVLSHWAFSRNGLYFATLSEDSKDKPGSLEVWDTSTGHRTGPPLTVLNASKILSVSGNGQRVLYVQEKAVHSWDVRISYPRLVLNQKMPIDSAFFNFDGSQVALIRGKKIYLWDAETEKIRPKPLEFSYDVHHAEFSSDGKFIIGCCSDNLFSQCYAQTWNTTTASNAGPPLRHSDGVLFAGFNSNDKCVATTGEDFTSILWDPFTGERLAPALQHKDKINMAAFSRAMPWLATASDDKTARIWNLETGDPLSPPLLHLRRIKEVQFLTDGKTLITTDFRLNHRLWPLPVDSRPVEDLQALVFLLADTTVIPGTADKSTPSRSSQKTWRLLHEKYPSQFTVSINEIKTWHNRQAEISESEHDWPAVLFHLNQLRRLDPKDASLIERHQTAVNHLPEIK